MRASPGGTASRYASAVMPAPDYQEPPPPPPPPPPENPPPPKPLDPDPDGVDAIVPADVVAKPSIEWLNAVNVNGWLLTYHDDWSGSAPSSPANAFAHCSVAPKTTA